MKHVIDWTAFAKGYDDYHANVTSNPYKSGTLEYESWEKGWFYAYENVL